LTQYLRRIRDWLATASGELAIGLPVFAAFPSSSSDSQVLVVVLTLVLLVISLGIHEAAHGWMALKCGDTTARDLGRITLNPIAHIDPFRTILLPLMLYYMNMPVFGGAKPVPVNFHRLRHPWRDMSLVAFAGPLSNFLLAIFFLTAWHFFVKTGLYNGASGFDASRQRDLLPVVLMNACSLNILLAVFNLVPIPPLDGSRILTWILPGPLRPAYTAIEPFGLFILFALLTWPPFGHAIYTVGRDVADSLVGLVTLGGLW
jgi:Zn-dependent protease